MPWLKPMSLRDRRSLFLAALIIGAVALIIAVPLYAARLTDAVRAGAIEEVRASLKAHADVNAADPDGTPPLAWAVQTDSLAITQLLLRAGANPKTANRYGVTPLSLACTNNDLAIVNLLLSAGADPNAASSGGQTILMTAARAGDAGIVKSLVEHGASVNTTDPVYGENALMLAAGENHPGAARVLIAHGAEVNAHSRELRFPQDSFGLEGVQTTLPHGNWTALMYAGRQGSLDAARVLLKAGADVNFADPDGTTALVFAIINGHFDTAILLVQNGADPNLADTAGMAALYAAVDMNTLGEVYGRPARPSNSKQSALDIMKILLEHGANPNARLRSATLPRAHTPGETTLPEGSTPLMRAAKNGDTGAIRLLLANKADPSLTQKNHTTALMLAAGYGRGQGVFAKDYATEAALLEAVQLLVEAGSDVNALNDSGQSAMHFAARASDPIVKYLAAHGAVVNVKDKQGHMPIDMARGLGVRGRAGGPVEPRESTIALLQTLSQTAPSR
jgi:uncharacterized protein